MFVRLGATFLNLSNVTCISKQGTGIKVWYIEGHATTSTIPEVTFSEAQTIINRAYQERDARVHRVQF